MNKKELLKSLTEDEFRTEILIPLIKRMSFINVTDNHGSNEFGKDIVFNFQTDLGLLTYSVVVKIGKITKAAGSKTNFNAIEDQIVESFDYPFDDINSKKKLNIDKVIVWTNDEITNQAERLIFQNLDTKYRHIEFHDLNFTINKLEEYYPEYFTIRDPIISEYFTNIRKQYRQIEELRILGCHSGRFNLENFYVDLTLTKPFDKKALDAKKIRKFTLPDLIKSKSNFIIIGQAGSGKSSLLRRLSLGIIQDDEKNLKKYPIPVFIECRKIDFTKEQCIEDEATKIYKNNLSMSSQNNLSITFEGGKFVFLFDGLDELKNEETIEVALNRIIEFSKRNPLIKILLTSRKINPLKDKSKFPNFTFLELGNLSETQIELFFNNWFAENPKFCKSVIHQIKKPNTFNSLPKTPLVLAVLALLFESGNKEIPANLTELYDKYSEMVLGRWDSGKDIALQIDWKIKQFILRQISWFMHNHNICIINKDQIESCLDLIYKDRGYKIDFDLFNQEIVQRSDLIVNFGEGFEFIHKSYQDYFAAKELLNQNDLENKILDIYNEPWWINTIFFACGSIPEDEHLITLIFQEYKNNIKDIELILLLQLALYLQANYLIKLNLKTEIISFILDNAIEKFIISQKDIKFPENLLSHLFLGILAPVYFGSITLSEPLKRISIDFLGDRAIVNNGADLDLIRKSSIKGYLLAIACGASGDSTTLKNIVINSEINDTDILFCTRLITNFLIESDYFDEKSNSELIILTKSMNSKIKRNKEFVKSLKILNSN